MIGINKAPIVLNLQTDFIQVTAGDQPRNLGKGKIVGVIFQNRLNNIDGTGNNVDVMIGFGVGQIWQLLPGQESPVVYANDLEDVFIRVRVAGSGPVDVAVIVYRQKKEG